MEDMSRREFEQHFERAVKQAQRILRDRAAAEDVAAEAMGRLIIDGKNPQHFKLIVHGLTVDAFRKQRRELPADPSLPLDDEHLPYLTYLEEQGRDVLWQQEPLTFEQVEIREDFDRALRALPVELDRQAFLLTTVRGLTLREAAEILDIDHTSVHRHAERARAQIKEALAA